MSKFPEETLEQENALSDSEIPAAADPQQETDSIQETAPVQEPDSVLGTEPEQDTESSQDSTPAQDAETPQDAEPVQDAELPQDTEPAQDAEPQDKFLAIKSALRSKESEQQQEEMRISVADKIQRMKEAKDNPDEQPYERSAQPVVESDAPADVPPEASERPRKTMKKKANSAKKAKKSRKTVKKRKRSGPDLFPKRGDSAFEVIRKCIFLMSCTVFMVCLFLIGKYYWENYQNAEVLKEFEKQYDPDRKEPERETEPKVEGFEYYGYLPSVEQLLEKNPEIIGFLSIPDSKVNYPVLQHKVPEDGNEYYLKRNYLLEHENAGSIFMDYRDYFDFVVDGRKQFENSDNLIIYGHNMHDYSMFGGLKRYINEANYYDEHPIIYLNSNYRKYQYKIFGMIIVDIEDETETKFDYWNTIDFGDEQQFYDYVNEIKRRTVRLTDVDVKYGDQLVTLSTCNSTFTEGRLVVFGRLLREGEDLMEGCTSQPNPNIKWPNSYYKWRKKTYNPDAEFIPYG
ncbi:MAG: class B sortase [Oscillospiraceae bacterium]|nr:class B sortase [Oscillospiraceae bacterium]